MKIIKRTLLVLITGLALGACKKDPPIENPPPGPDPNTPAVSAKISNKDQSFQNFFARVSNGHVFIYCSTSDGKKLQMEINNTKIGKYLVNQFEENNAVYTQDSANKFVSHVPKSEEGEINLTLFDTVNNVISGTFFFTLEEVTSKKLISIENGSFIKVPIVTSFFEDIHFISLFRPNNTSTTKMVEVDIDAIGQVTTKNLVTVGDLLPSPASNFGAYNSTSGIYNFICTRTEEFLYYKNSGYSLKNDWVYGHGAPTILNSKCYALLATFGSETAELAEINQVNGDTLKTLFSFTPTKQFRSERISSSPVGSQIYYLSNGVIEKVNPISKTHQTYDLNPQSDANIQWDAIEAISDDQVIAIKSVSETTCTLAKITLGTSATISQLIDFTVPECLGCDYSTLYNKTKNVYYLFSYSTNANGTTTTIRSFNLNNNQMGVSVFSGRLFGTEMMN